MHRFETELIAGVVEQRKELYKGAEDADGVDVAAEQQGRHRHEEHVAAALQLSVVAVTRGKGHLKPGLCKLQGCCNLQGFPSNHS